MRGPRARRARGREPHRRRPGLHGDRRHDRARARRPRRGARRLGRGDGRGAPPRLRVRGLRRRPVARLDVVAARRAGRGRGRAAPRARGDRAGRGAGRRGHGLRDRVPRPPAARDRGSRRRARRDVRAGPSHPVLRRGRAAAPEPDRAAAREGPLGRRARRGGGLPRPPARSGQPGVGALAVARGARARGARPNRRGGRPARGGAGRRAELGRARRARPARCACSARCRAATGSRSCTRRSRRPRGRPRGSSTPRRSPRWARPYGASGSRPRRASRCASGSRSPAAAVRGRSPTTSARSSTRRAGARGARR